MGPLCRMGTQVALRWGGRILRQKNKAEQEVPIQRPRASEQYATSLRGPLSPRPLSPRFGKGGL